MRRFPELDIDTIRATRNALHAYARVPGDLLKLQRPRRKHWWHASLRPSLTGLTTDVIHGRVDYEIELNLRDSAFCARTATGGQLHEALHGQPAAELALKLSNFLESEGATGSDAAAGAADRFPDYSPYAAAKLGQALSAVAGAMAGFRAGIREETSPIQLWPHHFDLSMIWLPGAKIPGQDPADEEHSDKQMNFGFVFGDEGIDEPYFYVTAHPLPDELAAVELPAGTVWRSDGFSGAVLLYKDVVAMDEPAACLEALWSRLYAAGQACLTTDL
ncbi:MAG: DUF5996 family protein [Pseudomonadota bacterium]